MHQSAPGFAPSLSARPDREAEFLKALGRRDAHTCLPLLQHLVHRRGVGALEGLRRRSLALEGQQLDWIWLDQLLVDQPISAVVNQPSWQQSFRDPDPGNDRVMAPAPASSELAGETAAEVPWVGSQAALALRQEPMLRPELDRLATAAVDAAFEALAAEFPGYGPALDPLQSSLPTSSLDRSDPLDQIQASEPAQAPLAEYPEPPVALFGDASLQPLRGSQPRRIFSFVIPRPLDPSPLADESDPVAPSCGDFAGQDQELAAESGAAAAGQGAGFWGRAEGRIAGLGDRLRGRFSLTRVKALMRDCVEEAVASLQGPNPGVELQPQLAQAQADAATTIAASAARGYRAAVSAASALSASWAQAPLEDDGRRSDDAALLSAHQAPVAAFGPLRVEDSGSENPSAAEPQGRLSTTQQLQKRLLAPSQGESRPAPAPQALSDLRAWLAADDDLPHAS